MARIAFMQPLERAFQININREILIEKAVEKCREYRCVYEISLSKYKNVELDLVIPREKNFINSWLSSNLTNQTISISYI